MAKLQDSKARRSAWPIIPVVEHFDSRYYAVPVPGKPSEVEYIESITTILGAHHKPFIERLRGDRGNREMDRRLEETATRGSIIHHGNAVALAGGAIAHQSPWWKRQHFSEAEIKKLTRRYGARFLMVPTEEEFHAIRRWRMFLDKTNPRVLAMNLTVYSLRLHLAGSLDIILGFHDVLFDKVWLSGWFVADWKGGLEMDDHRMQVAGYYELLKDMRPDIAEMIAGGLIIYQNASTKTGTIPGLKLDYRTPEQMARDFSDLEHVHAIWRRDNPSTRPEVFSYRPLIIGNQPLEEGEKKPKWKTIKADPLLSFSPDLPQRKPKASRSASKSKTGLKKGRKQSKPPEASLFETTTATEKQSTSQAKSSEQPNK